jgi:hypothetical protein
MSAEAPQVEKWWQNIKVAIPATGTEACQSFFDAWARTNMLLQYIIDSMLLISRLEEDQNKDKLAPVLQSEMKAFGGAKQLEDAVMRNRQLLWELLLGKYVDNVMSYLSDLLFEVFQQQPAMLKGMQVSTDLILEHSAMEDVIRAIAEKKVHELAYKSFDDLAKYFEKMGLPLGDQGDREGLKVAIEVRNISVHNRCIVNKVFLDRLPAMNRARLGCVYELKNGEVANLAVNIGGLVVDIDAAAVKHFRLEASPIDTDPHRYDGPPESKD